MGKITKRVLSLVLTVLLMLSMVSGIVMPASAAAITVGTELDYDALFTGKDTFLINPAWSDNDLAAGKKLTFYYRGETKTVTYDASKHFNSYFKAEEVIFKNLDASNYLTYQPVIIFAPGNYTEIYRVPSQAIILGANAGISPNAELKDADKTVAGVKENGGWNTNEDRSASNETVFANRFYFTTRALSANGRYDTQDDLTGEGAKYAFIKEQAFNANPAGQLNIIVDGIKSTADTGLVLGGYDAGKQLSRGGQTVVTVGGRDIKLSVNNSVMHCSARLVDGYNSSRDYYEVSFNDIRSTGPMSFLVQRYIHKVSLKNSFVTGMTGSMLNGAFSNMRFANGSLLVEDCIIYECTGNTLELSANANGLNITFKNNILYNFFGGNTGSAINNTNYDITFNITDNLIYHNRESDSLFVASPSNITGGKTRINFNRNKVISSTITAIAPRSAFSKDLASTLLYYDFSNNYYADNLGEKGKPITFAPDAVPQGPLASGWDFTDTNYYLDQDFKYTAHGLEITDVDFGIPSLSEINDDTMDVFCFSESGIVTPAFFVKEADAEVTKANFEIATDSEFENVITSVDLGSVNGVATFYLRSFYEGTDFEKVYKLRIIASEIRDFNDDFKTNGLNFGGYDLKYQNTAVLVNNTEYIDDIKVAYGMVGDQYYRFIVDDQLVFDNLETLSLNMSMIDERYVIIPSGDYGDMTIDFAATYLGTNAGINPVDKTDSLRPEGDDWKVGENWGVYDQTSFDTITVADGVEGKLVLDGITLFGQFNDTARTIGKDETVYNTLDIEIKNLVVNQKKQLELKDETDPALLKQYISFGSSTAECIFNLNNSRSVNPENKQIYLVGNEQLYSAEFKGFGDAFADSFVLSNVWIKNASLSSKIFNDYVPAKVTVDTLYCDTGDVIVGNIKTGNANKTVEFTLSGSNIRGYADEQNTDSIISFEGSGEFSKDRKLTDGCAFDVVIENNIFYNLYAQGITANLLSVAPAYMSSFKLSDNSVFNTNGAVLNVIAHNEEYAEKIEEKTLAIRGDGNVKIESNIFVGFNNNTAAFDIGLSVDNPSIEKCYVTDKVDTYRTSLDITGLYVEAMGDNMFWLNFERTFSSEDIYIRALEPKTSAVSLAEYSNKTHTVTAIITSGVVSDIGIVISQNATGKWYSDLQLSNEFDADTKSVVGDALQTYYYVVENDRFKTTYTVKLQTTAEIDFAKDFVANEYFDNTAVVWTKDAAGLENGTPVVIDWNGVNYRFYAGINAFDTLEKAMASTNGVASVLYPKSSQNSADSILAAQNKNDYDLVIPGAVKIFTPNYDVNPVVVDGYGQDSASLGDNWNTSLKYTENSVCCHNIVISEKASGTIEIYGMTVTGVFEDKQRKYALDTDIKLVNSSFVGTHAPSNSTIFTFNNERIKDVANKDSFTVKNAYFGAYPPSALIGQRVPANVTFDGILLDFANTGIGEIDSFVKQIAEKSTFTIKNSCIKNTDTDNKFLSFEGYIDDPSNLEGGGEYSVYRSNKINYENNIIKGFDAFGDSTDNSYLIRLTGSSYTDIVIKDNYIEPKDSENVSLFYVFKLNNINTSVVPEITVTGNIINGCNTIEYVKDTTAPDNFNWTLTDNFVVSQKVANVFASGVKGTAYAYNTENMTEGENLEYTYRIDAKGEIPINIIHDYEFKDTVTKNGNSLETSAVNVVVNKNGSVYEHSISFGDIIAKNDNLNRVRAKYDGKVVDLPRSDKLVILASKELTTIEIEVEIVSPDGKTQTESYALVISSTDATHCFSNYVSDNNATCYFDSTKTATCDGSCGTSDCSVTDTKVEANTKLSHNYSKDGVFNNDSTCISRGTVTFTCTNSGCNHTKTVASTGEFGDHLFENSAYKYNGDSNCVGRGTETAKCKYCDETDTRQSSGLYPAVDVHKMGKWVYQNDADCAHDGTEVRTCVYGCGKTEERVSPTHTAAKQSHVYGDYVYNGDASCVQDGTKSARCKICKLKKTVVDEDFLAKDQKHSFGEYVYNNDATAAQDGTKTAKCTVDGCKVTKTVTAKGTLDLSLVTNKFKDVKSGDWYEKAVGYVVTKGYVSGMEKDVYGVNVKITRGMFVTILARIAGVDTGTKANATAKTKFTDVKSGQYYTAAIKWANENGIVSGISEKAFAPNSAITREQLCVMIVNFAKAQNIELSQKADSVKFSDASKISSWAKSAVSTCQKAGIVSGYPVGKKYEFRPANNATRAEASQILYVFHSTFVNK